MLRDISSTIPPLSDTWVEASSARSVDNHAIMWPRDNVPFSGDGCDAGGEWYECDDNGFMGCCVLNACDFASGCPSGFDHTGTPSTTISETLTMSQTMTVVVSISNIPSTSGTVAASSAPTINTPAQATLSSNPQSTSSAPTNSSSITLATTSFVPSNTNSPSSTSSTWPFAPVSATPTSDPSSKSTQPTAGIVAGSVAGGIVLSIIVALLAYCLSRRRSRKQKYTAPSENSPYDETRFDAPRRAKITGEIFNPAWYKRFTGPSKSSSLSDSLQHTPDPNTYAKSPEMSFRPQNESIPEDDIPQLDSRPIFPQVELDSSTRSELDDTSPVTATNSPFIVSPETAFPSPNTQEPVSPELYEMGAGGGPIFPRATSGEMQNSSMQATLNRQAARRNNQHVMSWATYNSSRSDIDQQHGLGISSTKEVNEVMNRDAKEKSPTAPQS